MAINKEQLEDLIKKSLETFGLYSPEAVELLMGTAAVESDLGTYIKQIKGPAMGIFQMEPATHNDIWINYLQYKRDLMSRICMFYGLDPSLPKSVLRSRFLYLMECDLGYQAVMARIHYLRVKEKLPPVGDVIAQGSYWKRHYNTHLGKGTTDKYVEAFERHVEVHKWD